MVTSGDINIEIGGVRGDMISKKLSGANKIKKNTGKLYSINSKPSTRRALNNDARYDLSLIILFCFFVFVGFVFCLAVCLILVCSVLFLYFFVSFVCLLVRSFLP